MCAFEYCIIIYNHDKDIYMDLLLVLQGCTYILYYNILKIYSTSSI